jgi:hypothetical protein
MAHGAAYSMLLATETTGWARPMGRPFLATRAAGGAPQWGGLQHAPLAVFFLYFFL